MIFPGQNRQRTRLALVVLLAAAGCGPPEAGFPELTGDYLGQTPPGASPELFAPGIVSTGTHDRDVAMTPDGNELYFGVSLGKFTVIMQTKRVDGRWTEPEVAPFSTAPGFFHFEPHISPDGQRLFFLTNRPPDGSELSDEQKGRWGLHEDIWVVDRVGDDWSEPYDQGPPINTDSSEFYPSVTRDGTIYFTRSHGGASYIYRARLVDGEYAEPERLPPQVNSTDSQFNAFIAPDESYIIVPIFGRADSRGSTDYYIVFRNESDEWSEPINLGDEINTPGGAEHSAYVSPDGKYFFFMSTRFGSWDDVPGGLTSDYLKAVFRQPQNGNPDIYWMEAGFIDELRATAVWSAEP